MTEKTLEQLKRELLGNAVEPESCKAKHGKVFGGVGPTKKQLKQLNKMRAYLKADLLGMDLPKISGDDLKRMLQILEKNNISDNL